MNPLKKIFKTKPKAELFEEATNLLKNHFKQEFGDKVNFSISVHNARPKDELLAGECKLIHSKSGGFIHFIHFIKP